MQITFWGVRALVPAPGQQTTATGGNTLCVTVTGDAGDFLAVDAGTGITTWGRTLLAGDFGRGAGKLDLFITHPHYDHIQGFPFFIPAFIPGNVIRLYGSVTCKRSLSQVLESQMNPIFSPIQSLKNLNSILEFPEVSIPSVLQCGALRVELARMPHVTDQAMGVRITEKDKSIVLAPDVHYDESGVPDAVAEFFAGADVLVHDTRSFVADRARQMDRQAFDGRDAVAAAHKAGVKKLVLTHFHFDSTDDEILAMPDAFSGLPFEVDVACEGKTLWL